MAESTYDKFRGLLAELFMFDRADLDFGIYRIMNAKRDEVTRFLDHDLLPQVKATLSEVDQGQRLQLRADLEEAEKAAALAGFDPDDSPKVKDLRQALKATGDPEALEAEVFSDLYNFFRRYYKDGDFISLRRYKEGVYAIPYEGEEVKLYWANHDQYYIKSGEYFRDYVFRLPDGRRVHFKLVQADEERDNTKAPAGQERRFLLSESEPIRAEAGADGAAELIIPFEYKSDPQKRKREELIAEASQKVLSSEAAAAWLSGLAAAAPTDKNPRRTLLEKHLNEYTARNTFDYFIHKELGGFLRRELDFFIKNEVMHLDDIEAEGEQRVVAYLAKIRAIRRIAHKIIDFLAQLEDFQKKLWLKKKFVVETNYCVTLDRVPEGLYPEIAANEAQRGEWVRLFAIDEIAGDLTQPGYSVPLTVEFLNANPSLVLDTAHFSAEFKERLLASFDDLDEQTDGLLIHSENFQALQLLVSRYSGQARCIYIDPPFNTESDQFAYKDWYRTSSWASLMRDRIILGRKFLADDGLFHLHLDHNSNTIARHLLDDTFGCERFLNEVIWRIGWVSGYKTMADRYVRNHETIFIYTKTAQYVFAKDAARIPYVSKSAESLAEAIAAAKETFGLRGRRDVRLTGIVFKDGTDTVFKSGLADNQGRYNVEDTWNCNVYEDVDSNKIKRNAAEYTPNGSYLTQKPEKLLARIVQVSSQPGDLVVDYFAGSGTTPAVAKKLGRRFVAVESGEYFDSDLLHRMKTVLGGKRVGISVLVGHTPGGMFKYLRLESYEDALNNLELRRSADQDELLDAHPVLREDYTLRYMLDVESAGSASLLDLDRFDDPFSYTLQVSRGSVGETQPVTVDLVETFNYLLGLRVRHIDSIRGFTVVEGESPQGERVLVIWRNTREKSNAELDEFFQKQGYNTRDAEFDVIYVNGDNNLENLRRPDEAWKVRLIEDDFKRLMFDVQDV